MIIPKESRLSPEQKAEVESIVEAFNCKIEEIVGAGRCIYAILGDERHETMINRLLGLDYIDRVDTIDSPYKLMARSSELASHRVLIGTHCPTESPVFMAGPCTIDPKNPSLMLETAQACKEAGAQALRGGVWKPRTMPYSYQGEDKALDILLEARSATGLPIDTEVMNAHQLKLALDAGVDIIQIGARNAVNYSLLREIGEATRGTNTVVLLKRGRPMAPVDEFIAAAEYIVAAGNPNILLCPRGTLPALDGYRNHPDESISLILKTRTWAPVIADPSHSVGRAAYVPGAALAAMAYGADGLCIETHISPKQGIGDDPKQAITPEVLGQIIADAKSIRSTVRKYAVPE